jgi:hypothetical protein
LYDSSSMKKKEGKDVLAGGSTDASIIFDANLVAWAGVVEVSRNSIIVCTGR